MVTVSTAAFQLFTHYIIISFIVLFSVALGRSLRSYYSTQSDYLPAIGKLGFNCNLLPFFNHPLFQTFLLPLFLLFFFLMLGNLKGPMFVSTSDLKSF